MPINRSPPPTATSPKTKNLYQSDSEPNISSCVRESEHIEDFSCNVGTRGPKRKHDQEYKDELRSFKTEIMNLLKKSTDTHGSKYDQILTSLNELREENKELSNSVKFISSMYDDIQAKLSESEEERKEQLKYIRTLEDKIENIERGQKSASIELRNIPKLNIKETKTELVKVVEKMSTVLNCNIQKKDIRDVFRVSTRSDSYKPIIVEFTSCLIKETIMGSLKKFNKDHKDSKLNTNHLGIEGAPSPVYLTESLTTHARRLFYLSRSFAKDNDYAFCWTSYGRVYLRKAEGNKQIRIDHENDLKSLNIE